MNYDKAKHGYNRDWDTDNVPDDMTGEEPTFVDVIERMSPREAELRYGIKVPPRGIEGSRDEA